MFSSIEFSLKNVYLVFLMFNGNLLALKIIERKTWSGNLGSKTPISSEFREYVEKHYNGPE